VVAGYIYHVTNIIMSSCGRHSNTTNSKVEILRTLTKPFTRLIIQVNYTSNFVMQFYYRIRKHPESSDCDIILNGGWSVNLSPVGSVVRIIAPYQTL